MALKYRPDIDGLRAIAVLSVIAFHINEHLLPGGFVGVDIFFVISGYLISLHIMGEIGNGAFSIVEFYRRRIKRIAPAMFVVLGFTFLLAQFLFRPEDAEDTARAALWSIMSLANVFFWLFQDTSYFAADSNELPLLHLWSLGVEEQFYMLWPLVLLLTYRNSNATFYGVAMLIVAIASFVFGQYYFASDASFVYYMLPARAGELLIGALAAHHVLSAPARKISQPVVLSMALSGAGLVAGSVYLVSEQAPFPGYQAVAPTIGTVLLILAGYYGNTWPTRLLQLRPMVWVGLLSYSAYLWHWPLLAFLHYGGFEIGWMLGATVLALTMVLAWLTYRFVEQPLRRAQGRFFRIAAYQYAAPGVLIGLLTVVSLKTDGYIFHGLDSEYISQISEIRQTQRPAYVHDYVCLRQRVETSDLQNPDCVSGAVSEAAPHALVWGDSNASHYVGMIGAFAREHGFRFRNIQVSACPPLPSVPAEMVDINRLDDCRHSNRLIWSVIDQYPTVIISASWTGYLVDDGRFMLALEDMLRALRARGQRVVIVGKAPIVPGYDRLCREKAAAFPLMNCASPAFAVAARVDEANARLMRLAGQYDGVEYFDANRYLCPDGVCAVFNDAGEPAYFDAEHLTSSASWDVGAKILQADGVPQPFATIGNAVKQ